MIESNTLQTQYLTQFLENNFLELSQKLIKADEKSGKMEKLISTVSNLSFSEVPAEFVSPLEKDIVLANSIEKVSLHKKSVKKVNYLHPYPFPDELSTIQVNQIPKPAFKETDTKEKIESECLKRIEELYSTEKLFVEDMTSMMEVPTSFQLEISSFFNSTFLFF